jgi:hypothetical protein
LLSLLLLRVHLVTLLSAPVLVLPHLSCHHVFYILVWMKIVIELILVEIDLHLIKLIKAPNICKLALWLHDQFFLLIGIIICTSWNLIDVAMKTTKLSLRLRVLGHLTVDLLLQDVVCLRGTILFQ